ncbi:TDT family transporter [Methanobrevibacter sp.]|uniref:TDT family transporter n=1 Tax=Methanobrevibacter sp. TaxID=66852 RepID=UPI002E77BECC|nr:TDT family transporter [Methanobrevibacter sp.]MEE0938431.1 TDT family transporter [Methanobrevibacter sp.]
MIEKIPLPICGVILALFSLGNLLNDTHPLLKSICVALGMIFLILIISKLILYPEKIKADFQNPILTSNSGTFSMSLMLLSTYLSLFIPNIAFGIWILGVALHILLMIYFTYHFIIHNFNILTVYPSYWIVYVGITMGAITAHAHNLEEIGIIFFIVGFIAMILTMPLIIYRYIKYTDIPNGNKPLICIFTAVLSILIVGYINSFNTISNEFLIVMYIFACILYIFAFVKFIEYRNLKFYPSFAAFSFPFVISGLATKGVISKIGPNIILNNILNIETVIATGIVAYVLMKYIKFLSRKSST